MRFFILYLVTLLLFASLIWLNVTYVINYVFKEEISQIEAEELQLTDEAAIEFLQYIVYVLLYTLAFILFAILPAESLVAALQSGVLMAVVISVGASLVNYKYVQHTGLKNAVYNVTAGVVMMLLVTPCSYYLARYLYT